MVKEMFYSQVRGRRANDQPEEVKWKFDWWKLILVPLIGWAAWLTNHGFLAEKNAEKIDLQTEVLHNRVSGLDLRHTKDDQNIRQWILDEMMQLQKEIYTYERPNANQRQPESR